MSIHGASEIRAFFQFNRALDEQECRWVNALGAAFMEADAINVLEMLTPEQLLKIAQALIANESKLATSRL